MIMAEIVKADEKVVETEADETKEASTSASAGLSCRPRYSEGMEVLARWTDGLSYLGTIQKVDTELKKCFVTFEDNSEHWVLYKDIQKGLQMGEITCSLCHSGDSNLPNEIVLCDHCGLGYHQKCHQPVIHQKVLLSEDEPWVCRQCVFVCSQKVGGATRRGTAAKVFEEMKRSLPYRLGSLHWDSNHRTNVEQCYCYCGGPGDWFLKMLQCCRCKQWFHEACVQCLEMPMLYGDRFFIFVCSVCNRGPEYLKRLTMKWGDVAHLVLYNLTLLHKKKYYDIEEEIIPFLNEIWDRLQAQNLHPSSRLERPRCILEALSSSKNKFRCGKEVKKKKTIWGLRIRTPPIQPQVVLPAIGQITEEVMNDLQMKGRKVVTFVPVQSNSPVPLLRKRKSNGEIDKRTKKARKMLDGEHRNSVTAISSKNKTNTSLNGRCNTTSFLNSIPVGGPSVLDSIQPLETFQCGDSLLPATSYANSTSASDSSSVVSMASMTSSEILSRRRKRQRKWKKFVPEHDLELENGEDIANNFTVVNSKINGLSETQLSLSDLKQSIKSYFGVESRIASGEQYTIHGKRTTEDGQVQYLIEWDSCP
ncbi:metal-response element-binding transcription factor 2-like [Anneissia japonica]|uniref:metal-response element-binding transcription factor 2-like n=1 Tax=Anneissia japonica TaxID=1529436 RepID=UPI001425B8C5|nr:metal-response element-binding transcription factor 2-like [Anneissia japonica]XP_033095443.1 metal-response element-binding transcription factor 2-like [Anneissia japonica]XP_033095444.1 metal-response element-binding transcription factor 2-like [Anneissia japonica]XP_033095445.1 metal-response element-binding transcription factor 2-like [Anneissia japonica]XP_033095446.1 metal-response element-binding transcription factor 2-like [Anneissia japonica]XP_033095447.1 metal-response element-bi